MRSEVRWGILGSGAVARSFAQGLRSLPDARLIAVGSRDPLRAKEFARAFSVPRACDSYEDLVSIGDLDVVYVATPNYLHKAHCLLALNAGKGVLCEKPFALNAVEAREVIDTARRKQRFCMEAMWTRFVPAMVKLRQLIEEGAIGELCILQANLGFPVSFDEDNRYSNRQSGGGALFDIGIYTLSLASYLFGKPTHAVGQASIGPTGVDEQSAYVLSYGPSGLAVLHASLRAQLPGEGLVIGTQGQIRIHAPLWRPLGLTVSRFPESKRQTERSRASEMIYKLPIIRSVYYRLNRLFESRMTNLEVEGRIEGNGYNYEAAEVMRCMLGGKLESDVMPLDETLSILETMDEIRSGWRD